MNIQLFLSRMHRALVFLLLLILGLSVTSKLFAQDRLITTAGDTIHCQIESMDGQYIIFTQQGETQNKGKIAFDLVTSYEKNFDKDRMLVFETVKPIGSVRLPLDERRKKKGFMLGVGVGFVYRSAKMDQNLPDELKKYIGKLKTGIGLRVEGDYFFGRFFGIGAKYSFSYAQSKLDNVLFELDNGSYEVGVLSDKIQIHTVGLNLTSRIGDRSDRFHFLPGLSAGYSFYQDNAMALYPIKLTGGTFSIAAHLSMDFSLTEDLYSFLGFEYTSGILNYYDVEYANTRQRLTLSENSRDSLSRITFWGGFRYYFKSRPKPKNGYYD